MQKFRIIVKNKGINGIVIVQKRKTFSVFKYWSSVANFSIYAKGSEKAFSEAEELIQIMKTRKAE